MRYLFSRFVPSRFGFAGVCFDGEPNPPPPPPPPAPPPPAPPVPPPPPGQTPEQRIAQLENVIANTRAEAAANRVEARTATEQVTTAQAEVTRLRQEATDRETAARDAGNVELQATRTRLIDAELKAAAVQAGLTDTDLLPLIDKRAVRYNPDGTISGVTEAIAEAKTRKPDWFKAQSGRHEPPPVVRTGSSLPPPVPGAQAPATSVRDIPKTPEGKREYEAAKRTGLASLRGQ